MWGRRWLWSGLLSINGIVKRWRIRQRGKTNKRKYSACRSEPSHNCKSWQYSVTFRCGLAGYKTNETTIMHIMVSLSSCNLTKLHTIMHFTFRGVCVLGNIVVPNGRSMRWWLRVLVAFSFTSNAKYVDDKSIIQVTHPKPYRTNLWRPGKYLEPHWQK